MNHESSLPNSTILRKAKQLAALTSFIRDEFGGCTIESRESELVSLAGDLATRIYHHFGHGPCPASGAARAAYGASGKVAAVITSISHACDRAMAATSDEDRDACASDIGWLQLTAGDMAEDLVQHIEQLCSEGAAA